MTRDGDIETSISSFLARYGTNADGSGCNSELSASAEEDSCLVFPDRLEKATRICDRFRLLSESCSYDFDVEKMYQQCIERICGSDNEQSICKFLSVFRNQCRKA